ncbi:hypothetical protein [Labedella endophytica]|uniref:Uncharacterized protein n=1 Tax=Labedella endophytica TaxID=1523160 RepID=A0A3S0X3S8_9MICO|nr:hypothetical protein [Labedella endophytica]RUQ97091.1 hypothetical protein ELQ94_16150 [Labedella endophytica]
MTAAPTSSASVSTDASRLAEAVDAFTVFNAALDGYYSGTKSIEDLQSFVTPDYFRVLVAEEAERDTSTWTMGTSTFGDEKLVDPDKWGGHGDLSLVVCRNISRTEVVDDTGAPSTVKPLRTRIPLIVYFMDDDTSGSGMLIEKVDQWNEDGYCS